MMTHTNLHTEEERILADFEHMERNHGWLPEHKERVRDFIHSALASYRQVMRKEVEGMKQKPRCTRKGGCGLPLRQGAECLDGDLCEDVSVQNQYNTALDKVATLLQDTECFGCAANRQMGGQVPCALHPTN